MVAENKPGQPKLKTFVVSVRPTDKNKKKLSDAIDDAVNGFLQANKVKIVSQLTVGSEFADDTSGRAIVTLIYE